MLIKKTLKVKTAHIRQNIVYSIAHLLTPTLYGDFKENNEFVSRVPRPFTLMLHDVFHDKPLKGLEIGFGVGDNAENILNTLNVEKLLCVDPCIGKSYVDWNGVNNFAYGKTDKYFMLKAKSNVEFVELTSDEASKVLSGGFDFVYVDGVHSYAQCLRDLCNYYPLVKVGGFIGGHDFTKGNEAGVIKAVFEFSVSVGLIPVIVMPDFWFSVTANCRTEVKA